MLVSSIWRFTGKAWAVLLSFDDFLRSGQGVLQFLVALNWNMSLTDGPPAFACPSCFILRVPFSKPVKLRTVGLKSI